MDSAMTMNRSASQLELIPAQTGGRRKTAGRTQFDPAAVHREQLAPLLPTAPFLLRSREKDSDTLLIVSHRGERIRTAFDPETGETKTKRSRLCELGSISKDALRVCLPVFRNVVSSVRDAEGIALGLEEFLRPGIMTLGLKLPLDEEAGAKIGLVCRLQSRTRDLERIELMALRVARFSREEALYWLSRTTLHEREANGWAVSGLKIMLCGHGGPAVRKMLEKARSGR
jgi:hypothetical protein